MVQLIFLPPVQQSTFPSFSLPNPHAERLVSLCGEAMGVQRQGRAVGLQIRAAFLDEVVLAGL